MMCTMNKKRLEGGEGAFFRSWRRGFLSVICRDILHLWGCLMLHCFLETSLSYSSIIERKEVQRLIMKVGSITMFALL